MWWVYLINGIVFCFQMGFVGALIFLIGYFFFCRYGEGKQYQANGEMRLHIRKQGYLNGGADE